MSLVGNHDAEGESELLGDWHMLQTQQSGRLRLENPEFEASLKLHSGPCLKAN